MGGSLGSSEGEKITKSFEYGLANKIPVVVQCKTGGARMQEGIHFFMYFFLFILLIHYTLKELLH